MSRAEVSRDPSWVLIRNFLVRNHCTPPSVRFVFGIAIPGAFGSLGRPSPKHKPGKTTGGTYWARSIPSLGAGSQSNTNRIEAHMVGTK
jgi:hypothetical protein